MKKMEVIARIHTQFPSKFGIPRQSGLVPSLRAEIVFEPPYRDASAIKGIEEFSHLWLIFEFSKAKRENVSLTVTPPRLGGKVHKGVFATRSPFRPNSLGLSSVRLESVRMDERLGPILVVSGADLLDDTPIFDIKPYLPYADCHTDAVGGFGEEHKNDCIAVEFPKEELEKLPKELQQTVIDVLGQDPRAAYNKKEDYVYGMSFAGYDIRFTVVEEVLQVREVLYVGDKEYKKVK